MHVGVGDRGRQPLDVHHQHVRVGRADIVLDEETLADARRRGA